MILTREQILAVEDIPRETVTVPEWGGEVIVRVMSGTERDAYEVEAFKDRDAEIRNMRARLVARCCVNEAGEKLFTLQDAEALGRKSSVALDRVAQVAQRINKLSDTEVEKLKGNSEPTPGAEPSSL